MVGKRWEQSVVHDKNANGLKPAVMQSDIHSTREIESQSENTMCVWGDKNVISVLH